MVVIIDKKKKNYFAKGPITRTERQTCTNGCPSLITGFKNNHTHLGYRKWLY